MKALRKINIFSGVIALLLFLIMFNILYFNRAIEGNMCFYYTCQVFFVVGSFFLLTSVIFALYAVIRRIRQKRYRLMIRHYIFAALAIYTASLIIGYIVKDELLWDCLPYSFLIALFHLYISGFKLSEYPMKPSK